MTRIPYETFTCPKCDSTFILTEVPVLPLPQQQVSKLKLFIEIFNALAGEDHIDVNQHTFISELLETGKFSGDEAKLFLRKAMENGQVFERSKGLLAKA